MSKENRLNLLKKKEKKLLTILYNDKKLEKENSKFIFCTLISPLLLMTVSFITHLIAYSTFTYIILISSCAITIPIFLFDLAIVISGGYKNIIQTRIKNIQKNIEKLETAKTQKNKSVNEQERVFLDIEKNKQEKTWDDVLYTEKEIHQYMQMPESPVPFNPETIFETNTINEEEANNLQYKLEGPRLIKKIRTQKKK